MPCLVFCLRIFPYLWFLLFFPPFFDPWNPALLDLDPPGNLGFLYPEMSFTLSLVFILPPFFFPPKPNFLSLYFLLSRVFSPFLLWKVGLYFRLNGPPVVKKIKIYVSNRYYHILLNAFIVYTIMPFTIYLAQYHRRQSSAVKNQYYQPVPFEIFSPR